jgi:membrane-bound lytic murein transglycosylase A
LMRASRFAALSLTLFVAACSGRIVPPAEAPRPPLQRPAVVTPAKPIAAVPTSTVAVGPNAKLAGVVAGPALSTFNIGRETAERALSAFRLSCPSVLRRTDSSGLTVNADWRPACSAAAGASDPVAFFEEQFDLVQVGTGAAHATGYYVSEIEGSRTKRDGYNVPVYGKPAELVEVDLGQFSDSLKGKRIRGKVNGNTFVPYADRAQIDEGALAGRGLEIAWAKDPYDFFVLQIQGSGILRLPDGGRMTIGYDSQNGRDYTGIGKVMRDRGLLAPGKATMQDIVAWLRANPEQGKAIMQENKSWVFFRELTRSGALGALGTEVVARGTVAADPMFVPLGAPVILSMDRAEPNGLWVAQDTGGAIKGANRFDTFWGAGEEAFKLAGGMSARGTAFILLPKGVLARHSNASPTP